MNRNLETRLRKIEERQKPENEFGHLGFGPCLTILAESDEDEAQQLAALEAAGQYGPGQFVISRRIVDPPAYRRPTA
ncbi:hypothetical protein J2X36_004621 [Methylobacterium sp. BE186]|uniref:hypothetical protein n=1 Tax=Methylobacterium sp. BE186 TaxID=2817715 RepID=UPI00285F7418|nr:hypothetical protein [Methylobacterium sp. BE186]MDR7039843.1 hypothetical protein [Methylobacterium sp. BE186]